MLSPVTGVSTGMPRSKYTSSARATRTDWKSISPEEFESFCGRLLELNGFTNVVWHGARGGDRGRDLTAKRQVPLLDGVSQSTQWVVQCKRYITGAPSKAELNAWLVACREHKPDYVLFIHTGILTSNVKDWLFSSAKDFPYRLVLWERRELERELTTRRGELIEQFPNLYRGNRPILDLDPIEPSEFSFFVSQFEVRVTAYNCDDEPDAVRKIAAFLEYARHHALNFRTGRAAISNGES